MEKKRHSQSLRKCGLAWVRTAFAACTLAISAWGISESEIFELWDEGLILPEEASEIILLLEDGNEEEAEMLARVYGIETTGMARVSENTSTQKKSGKKKSKKAHPLVEGHLSYRERFDSTGNSESRKYELMMKFYRFTLHKGSRELLEYSHKGYKAYLGDISTKELESRIPLDTMWGALARLPVGIFRMEALIDTAGIFSGGLGASFGKTLDVDGKFFHTENGKYAYMGITLPYGNVAVMGDTKMSSPLLRIRMRALRDEEISWAANVYIHGSSVPEIVNLSGTIRQSLLFATEEVSLRLKEFLDTRISTALQVLRPLDSDSISTKANAKLEAGYGYVRGSIYGLCTETAVGCERLTLRGKIITSLEAGRGTVSIAGSAGYTRNKDGVWGRPKTEAGVTFTEAGIGHAAFSIAFPDTRPQDRMNAKVEFDIREGNLGISLAATFKKKKNATFKPSHSIVKAIIYF